MCLLWRPGGFQRFTVRGDPTIMVGPLQRPLELADCLSKKRVVHCYGASLRQIRNIHYALRGTTIVQADD